MPLNHGYMPDGILPTDTKFILARRHLLGPSKTMIDGL
jgi:hypothetical protein